jgi:hypothetical protein
MTESLPLAAFSPPAPDAGAFPWAAAGDSFDNRCLSGVAVLRARADPRSCRRAHVDFLPTSGDRTAPNLLAQSDVEHGPNAQRGLIDLVLATLVRHGLRLAVAQRYRETGRRRSVSPADRPFHAVLRRRLRAEQSDE